MVDMEFGGDSDEAYANGQVSTQYTFWSAFARYKKAPLNGAFFIKTLNKFFRNADSSLDTQMPEQSRAKQTYDQ